MASLRPRASGATAPGGGSGKGPPTCALHDYHTHEAEPRRRSPGMSPARKRARWTVRRRPRRYRGMLGGMMGPMVEEARRRGGESIS